jgi:uncharacterized protein YegL
MNSSNNHSSFLSPVIDIETDFPTVSRTMQMVKLDFAANPQPRCPVLLLLDCSSSMAGEPIRELQEGVGQFYQEVGSDPIARLSVEPALITFGSSVNMMHAFEPAVDSLKNSRPRLDAGGNTPMGAAITLGLNEISARRRFYKAQGLAAYKPWMILFTDGQPNDEWHGPAARAREKAARGGLQFLGIGIGQGVDMQTLASILPPDCPPHLLQGLRFKEFFRWLADSLKVVTSGSTTQQRATPHVDEYDWAM